MARRAKPSGLWGPALAEAARRRPVGPFLVAATPPSRLSLTTPAPPFPSQRSAPLKWSSAGAWPKAGSPPGRFAFSVPPGGPHAVDIDLDVAAVSRWVTNDAANFGVLLKLGASAAASVTLASGGAADAGSRPALTLNFTTGG
jgi:hypothetical protein